MPKYSVVRSKYAFLLHNDNIIGSDLDSDLREREKKAEKIAGGENIASEIENYLCNGCVNGERIQVYRRYFECFYECSGKRVEYGLYERLWQQIIRSDSK